MTRRLLQWLLFHALVAAWLVGAYVGAPLLAALIRETL